MCSAVAVDKLFGLGCLFIPPLSFIFISSFFSSFSHYTVSRMLLISQLTDLKFFFFL